MNSFLKKYSLVIIFIILSSYFIDSVLLSFKQLPSPLFGGDYYFQLGHVHHLFDSGPFLSSSNIIGSLPGYLPLYPFCVASFAKIFSLDPMQAMLYFGIILVPLAIFLVYYLLNSLFDSHTALLTLLIAAPISSFFILKYSTFSQMILMPLFLIMFYCSLTKSKLRYPVLTGFIFGLAGLAHTIAFIAICFIIGITFVYSVCYRVIKKKTWNNVSIKKTTQTIAIISGIGILIGLLYWYKPLFIFHGKTPNPYLEWNGDNFHSLSVQASFFLANMKNTFFNYNSFISIFSSICSILGIIYLFFLKQWTKRHHFIAIILCSAVIGTFHYIITVPLLNTHFYPPRFEFIWFYLRLFLVGCGIFFIVSLCKKKISLKIIYSILIILIFLTGTLSFLTYYYYQKDHQWYEVGRQPFPEYYETLGSYIKTHSDKNSVILSNNELSFMINGITGRKVVTTRRAQNSPFLDMDRRVLDAAIMLYGNNNEKRSELLEKYNIRYFLWDMRWFQLEYTFDDKGNIISYFDPLLLFKGPKAKAELEIYNISYIETKSYVDPAIRGPEVKQFDLYLILPHQMNQQKPWHPGLDVHLREVWNYTENNMVISQLYEII